jgi:ketosteroid isomerase-like protein
MSQENVELIARTFELTADEDWEALERLIAPDCQVLDFDLPDTSEPFHGPDGWFAWLAQWDSAWDSWTIDEVEVRDAGGDRVVAEFRVHATGRGSGLELDRHDAIVYALRDGQIVSLEYYNEGQKAEALADLKPEKPE